MKPQENISELYQSVLNTMPSISKRTFVTICMESDGSMGENNFYDGAFCNSKYDDFQEEITSEVEELQEEEDEDMDDERLCRILYRKMYDALEENDNSGEFDGTCQLMKNGHIQSELLSPKAAVIELFIEVFAYGGYTWEAIDDMDIPKTWKNWVHNEPLFQTVFEYLIAIETEGEDDE